MIYGTILLFFPACINNEDYRNRTTNSVFKKKKKFNLRMKIVKKIRLINLSGFRILLVLSNQQVNLPRIFCVKYIKTEKQMPIFTFKSP